MKNIEVKFNNKDVLIVSDCGKSDVMHKHSKKMLVYNRLNEQGIQQEMDR